MAKPVYILGGAQSDFARNWSREGLKIEDMMREVLEQGVANSGVDLAQLDSAHVGNFVAELFCGQGQLGGILAGLDPRLSGLPISRHEAACASGSIAILSAMAEIEAGRAHLSCAIGLEYMRNVPGETAAQHLGSAAMAGEEWQDARYVWPRAFSDLYEAYAERFGAFDYKYLGEIARINYDNAKRNPYAQTRKWQFEPGAFTANDALNPVIEGHVRRNDCGQVTDGAAVVFLASEEAARAHVARHGGKLSDLAVITGWGHRTAPMRFAQKIAQGANTPFVLPEVNRTITETFKRAGVASPFELDLIETHDCFAMTEYAAIDSFGITAPGESWKAIEEGVIARDGRLPINPSGGLIGLGHPVGATGIRMLKDLAAQVTGQAGETQVEGARRAAMLNIGGSTTTICSFVVERAE